MIKFRAGDLLAECLRPNLPFYWTSQYLYCKISSSEQREYDLSYLSQGAYYLGGHPCTHFKVGDVDYFPDSFGLSWESIPSSSLAFPTQTLCLDGSPYGNRFIRDGDYVLEDPTPDWGGWLFDASLSIHYPYIEGHWIICDKGIIKQPDGTVIPNPTGILYEYWISSISETESERTILNHWNGKTTRSIVKTWIDSFVIRRTTVSLAQLPTQHDVASVYASKTYVPYDKSCVDYKSARKAIDNLDVIGINWYENFAALCGKAPSEILSFGQSLKAKFAALFDSGVLDRGKAAADLYLSKKYGVDNDVRDLKSLLEGFPKFLDMISKNTLRMQGGFSISGSTPDFKWSLVARSTLWGQPFLSGIVWDDVLGITPSFSNLWAIVPFSFAIDWVLHCGDNLAEIEQAWGFSHNKWNISHRCLTEKLTAKGTPPGFPGWTPGSSMYEWSFFRRSLLHGLPTYQYDAPDYGLGEMKNHVFETIALVLNAF